MFPDRVRALALEGMVDPKGYQGGSIFGPTDKIAPGFGSYWAFGSAQCATWPGKDHDRYTGNFHARTASPALIVNATLDPSTHHKSAVKLSRTMPAALKMRSGSGTP